MTLRDTKEPDLSYFGLQAHVGTTKHMGGHQSTRDLVDLCHVSGGRFVLDVGCGAGATTSYLVKTLGCRAVGVDVRGSMVNRAQARAQREGVGDRTVFSVADAQTLPFESDLFDAVLIESVATFIEDKGSVVTECARVTRPGGYVGFNEEVWLKRPPPEMLREAHRAWEIRPNLPSPDEWRGFLEGAGLVDVKARVHRFDWLRESSQIRRYRPSDMLRMLCKTLCLYARNAAFRQYMSRRKRLPRDVFDYLGYALFVGKK